VQAFKDAWNWHHKQPDPLNNLAQTIAYPPPEVLMMTADLEKQIAALREQ
jgi:hypothetical protein